MYIFIPYYRSLSQKIIQSRGNEGTVTGKIIFKRKKIEIITIA